VLEVIGPVAGVECISGIQKSLHTDTKGDTVTLLQNSIEEILDLAEMGFDVRLRFPERLEQLA
jgi:hypothetical protein